MPGGQQTDLSPGSVTPSENVALTGEGLSLSQGTIVADAEDGIELAGEGLDVTSGQIASAFLVGLRSRKIGSGSATKALTGASMNVAQGSIAPILSRTPTGIATTFLAGSFGKTRSKVLTGSASNFAAGTLTFSNQNEPTWVGVVPTVTFTNGTSGTYDLTQHTLSFNTAQHAFELLTGALPSGVTINPIAGYVYNGTGPTAVQNVSLTIVDTVLTPEQDFANRVAAVGSSLIRTWGFNSSVDLGGTIGAPVGKFSDSGDPLPVIDTSIKASGAGSMRFDMVANPSVPRGANWWGNLSDNYSVQIDAGQQVNLQFRYRATSEITADYAAKIFLFGTGDTVGTFESSCTDLEIEMNSQIFGQKHLAAYNACPGSCGAGSIFPFDGGNPGGTRFLAANQWMTIQLQVILGPRELHGGHEWFAGSNVKIWIQYEPTPGVPGPEILLYDVTLGVGGSPGLTPSSSPPCWGLCAGHGGASGKKYGKMWLLAYNQELDPGAQPGQVWYDDLIVARVKIPAAQA